MSKAINADITHEFKRRMQNWSRWSLRGGLAQISPSSMWSSAPSGSRGEIQINTLDGEADDTDRALNSVAVRFRQAVMLFWQYEDKELTFLARKCGIDYRTYEKRVIQGHQLLRAELYKFSEQKREMREQFEKMRVA